MEQRHVIVEELTLTPIGNSKELGFKPLRITIDGKRQMPIFDARGIAELKRDIREYLAQQDSPKDSD